MICTFSLYNFKSYDFDFNRTDKPNVTLYPFFIEIYASCEIGINNISIDVWFGQYLKIWNLRVQKNLNIEKIIFKVVQIKS